MSHACIPSSFRGFGVILLALHMTTLTAFAAQSSHGTDNINGSEGAVWFLGAHKTAKYCIEVSGDFGVAETQIATELQLAFEQWTSYIEARLPIQEINERHAHRNFTTRFVQQDCNGQQDVTFYFGTQNKEVSREKAQYSDPAAFAHREKYDEELGWSKGFVWVTSPRSFTFEVGHPQRSKSVHLDWEDPYALKTILMHEIGHILGVEHVLGTVMDEHILRRILASKLYPESCPRPSSFGAKIDNEKELQPCLTCFAKTQTWSGVVADNAARELLGRSPVAPTMSHVVLGRTGFQLKLQDALGSKIFDLATNRTDSLKYSVDPLAPKTFRIHFKENGVSFDTFFQPKLHEIRDFYLSKDGREFNILLKRNALDEKSPLIMYWKPKTAPAKYAPLFLAESSYVVDGCAIPGELQKPFWLLNP